MRAAPFLIGAIVLIAFAIAGSAAVSATFLSVSWTTWLCASVLSFLTHLLLGIYLKEPV